MSKIDLEIWHDENLVFHRDEKISFAQCTPDGKMSWSEILKFTSDNAGEDFTQRGMGWEWLQKKGIVFIATRISFKVYRMPLAEQLITLRTWEAVPAGPLASRMYEIVDKETKEVLVKGYSLWTILDLNTKRLIPSKAYQYRPLPTAPVEYHGIKPGKITIPENMEKLGTHKILYSELDANGHVNNSKYINFAIDYLPPEYRSKEISEFRLNYTKEAHIDDSLEIFANINQDENKAVFQGLLNGESSFDAEIFWK